ncbi:MAG: ribonuclease HII [Flavobacteriales bacterium]|nr:ribonuclease HII [Flavobacteriales bacterium]
MKRLKPFFQKNYIEAGCDEAGRGCLAGPVVAAAVILPRRFSHPLLNDSKQLSEHHRDELRPIIESQSLAWAVGMVWQQEIDEINILNASFLAMHRALEKLEIVPQHIIVDGNRFRKFRDIEHQCIIKGDALYRSIAAASILAKTHRDEVMKKLHDEFPLYNWKKNKGYPTMEHREAIREVGDCVCHRKTFRLLPVEMESGL